MAPSLTIVMPVLNEAAGIDAALMALTPLRARGARVVVADGGSSDDTVARARRVEGVKVIQAPRGRAAQMNAGAQAVAAAPGGLPAVGARNAILLFLHADTTLPAAAETALQAACAAGVPWGRFDVSIVGASAWFPLVSTLMNWRSRLSGIATGDQAIFVQAALFRRLGGFADQPLMEDIELSRRLRRIAPPACLTARVATSGRRWESRGVWRTIWLMWRLRWRYWRGAAPEVLARAYR